MIANAIWITSVLKIQSTSTRAHKDTASLKWKCRNRQSQGALTWLGLYPWSGRWGLWPAWPAMPGWSQSALGRAGHDRSRGGRGRSARVRLGRGRGRAGRGAARASANEAGAGAGEAGLLAARLGRGRGAERRIRWGRERAWEKDEDWNQSRLWERKDPPKKKEWVHMFLRISWERKNFLCRLRCQAEQHSKNIK
jgi:hypothetical protein